MRSSFQRTDSMVRRPWPPPKRRPRASSYLRDDDDVRCLRALRALAGLERDLRPLGERLEAVTGDVAVMHEQVLRPLGGLDKTETLRIVEPLHGSFCHMKYTSHHYLRTHWEGALAQTELALTVDHSSSSSGAARVSSRRGAARTATRRCRSP